MAAMSRQTGSDFVPGFEAEPVKPVSPQVGRTFEDLRQELANVQAALKTARRKDADLRAERVRLIRKGKATDAIAGRIHAAESEVQGLEELVEQVNSEMEARSNAYAHRRTVERNLTGVRLERIRADYVARAIEPIKQLQSIDAELRADERFRDKGVDRQIDSAVSDFLGKFRGGNFGARVEQMLRIRPELDQSIARLESELAEALRAEAGR